MTPLITKMWRQFRDFGAVQADLWDRHVYTVEPWTRADWLRWVRRSGEWRLAGSIIPGS